MSKEFGIFSERAIKPTLLELAKEKGLTYEEIRAIFIEKIAKPKTEEFKKKLPEYQENFAKALIESSKSGMEIHLDGLIIKDGKVTKEE